jgi:hypothetical protein
VNVPLPKPLLTAGGAVTSAPLVLIDLETRAGVVGRLDVRRERGVVRRSTSWLIVLHVPTCFERVDPVRFRQGDEDVGARRNIDAVETGELRGAVPSIGNAP